MKRPAFQFYPSDWRSDAGLQSCSIAARGLWHELLCVMHECRPYGHMAINGNGIDDAQAARLVGVPLSEYRRLLAELERVGVFSRTAAGIIFSRRMVKDEHLRSTRAASGRLGGNPLLLNQNDNHVDKPPDNQGGNQTPTPSSSSSSSNPHTVATPTGGGETPVAVDNPGGDKSPSTSRPTLTPRDTGKHRLVEDRGRRLGLSARPGESWEDFAARVEAQERVTH